MLKRTDLEIKRQEILFQFLQHIGEEGGTLVINGDLFDFYFEYKDVIPKVFVPFYHEILKLRERGVKVHFVLGIMIIGSKTLLPIHFLIRLILMTLSSR